MKKNRNLNSLFQKLFCSTPKVPIWTRMIFRNAIKRSRMFYQLLLTQIVQISIVFLSVKSIIMKIKEWYHVSLTSNISAKTWSNWTCRGCFGNVRTSRFQICPWFWKSTKICGSNRAKQNITDFFPLLYIDREISRCPSQGCPSGAETAASQHRISTKLLIICVRTSTQNEHIESN